MFFNGKHLCKTPHPFDATTFDLKHPSVRDNFKAVFEMTILAEVVKEKSEVYIVTTYSDVRKAHVNISVTINKNKAPVIRPVMLPATFEKQVHIDQLIFLQHLKKILSVSCSASIVVLFIMFIILTCILLRYRTIIMQIESIKYATLTCVALILYQINFTQQ